MKNQTITVGSSSFPRETRQSLVLPALRISNHSALAILSKGGAIKHLLDLLHHIQPNELLDSGRFLEMQRVVTMVFDLSHYIIRAFAYSSFLKIVNQVLLGIDDFLIALLELVEVNWMPLVFDKLCEFIAYFLDILLHLGIVSC